ncbi:MAG: hypothetical protein H0T11_00325, partial [Chthoniobacterales bacterium]|nr:hypothetical protein [Chthoniobacterales bacterium]
MTPVPAPTTAATAPTTEPSKLEHVTIDAPNRTVRVEAEMLGVEAPLEFFCVQSGTNEHESVLRSPVKASHLHLALLIIGLEPGSPLTYSDATKKWTPPHGPPLHIALEWTDDKGKAQSMPAYRAMRNLKTKEPMPALTWVFTGSRVMEDSNYAADVTGYLISVVNFDLTVIDVPELKSSSEALLEWERNPDAVPPAGTKVTLVIRPAGKDDPAATNPAADASTNAEAAPNSAALSAAPSNGASEDAASKDLTGVAVNQVLVEDLQQRWEQAVAPHKA